MNASAEAADQIVRMSLNGVEVAAKITGKGAENSLNLLSILCRIRLRPKARLDFRKCLKAARS